MTRTSSKPIIDAYLEAHPDIGRARSLHFSYYDPPRWLAFWKHRQRGVQAFYYLWQVGAVFHARRLVAQGSFDVIHHVTFGRYWSPSFLALLDVPFVWGPIGGGEPSPVAFWSGLPLRELIREWARTLARSMAAIDPFVHMTARRASVVLPATPETAETLLLRGKARATVVPQVAFRHEQLRSLGTLPRPAHDGLRFLSVGRAVGWKGFHLALAAYAAADTAGTEYWLLVNGPERARLERLAARLGIADRTRFLDPLESHEDVHRLVAECDVFVHPAFHETFGTVILEAMAIGLPVICLGLGGPGLQVTPMTGFAVPATSSHDAIAGMARAMRRCASDRARIVEMGRKAQERVQGEFSWPKRRELLQGLYSEAARSVRP
ncbi:MAG: glycosyltransferase family 4 protein [Deinococcales bacterium]